MPANLITLLHFSTSSLMNLGNSPGEFAAAGMTPSSMSRCLILGAKGGIDQLVERRDDVGRRGRGGADPIQPSAS